MVKHKYVRHSHAGFIIWPSNDQLWHKHIGNATLKAEYLRGEIVSAGFVTISANMVYCFGRSDSLNKDSKPEDSNLLAQQLGLEAI